LNDIQSKTEEIGMLHSKLSKKQQDVLQMDAEVERYKIQVKALNDQVSELQCLSIEQKARSDTDVVGTNEDVLKNKVDYI
jgi:peptidoglycan hydrolase CwlO-like protein